MEYNPQLHHRRSIRLKGYDYAQAGLYFITLCCEGRICRFGSIQQGEMRLNEWGNIAYAEWLKTPVLRPNTELHEFVIMPNHVHGIIRITGRGELHSPHDGGGENNGGECDGDNGGESHSPLRSPSQTVGAIVRGYKSAVTKQGGLLGFTAKLWQRNYWEHIIRNESENQRIAQYIIDNPQKWENDTLNNGIGNRVL